MKGGLFPAFPISFNLSCISLPSFCELYLSVCTDRKPQHFLYIWHRGEWVKLTPLYQQHDFTLSRVDVEDSGLHNGDKGSEEQNIPVRQSFLTLTTHNVWLGPILFWWCINCSVNQILYIWCSFKCFIFFLSQWKWAIQKLQAHIIRCLFTFKILLLKSLIYIDHNTFCFQLCLLEEEITSWLELILTMNPGFLCSFWAI